MGREINNENSTSTGITKEMLEESIAEHKSFIKMVCKNKYGHEDIKDVIEGVISYCAITDDKQKELLRSGKFIPAGSILSTCNTDNKGSFSNCYFLPIRHDSIEGIFEAQKQIARTFSYRGGIGTDITILRPKDTPVENAAKTSSGSVSFMPSFSEITKTICQRGRRGALLISIDIRHPDALDFIWSKADPDRVFERDIFSGKIADISNANLTIKLSDSFMRAVEADEDWTFCFPDIDADKDKYNSEWNGDYDEWMECGGTFKEYQVMKAKDILGQLSEASWICGDPGISLIDTVQKNTFGTHIHKSLKPKGYNACCEEPMADDNSCLLSAFVLHRYVINPYSNSADFLFNDFKEDVKTATRLMNIFSDINADKHPLQEQRDADKFGKRIGLEMTGIGDMFAMLGDKYGDSITKYFIGEVTKYLLFGAISESIELAKEIGPCKALEHEADRKLFLENLSKEDWLKLNRFSDDILKYGLHNTSFNTVGPCGSISILSDNCTSGIEPLFKFSYRRKNRIDNKEYEFIHYNACKYMLANMPMFKGVPLKNACSMLNYVEAESIKPSDRIKIQSAVQRFTDTSISSTINLPSDCTKEQIVNIYIEAWKSKLKGITVFRDGCKEGVLTASTIDKKEEKVVPPGYVDISKVTESILIEKELLPVETAERHLVMWKKSKAYLSVSLDGDDPIEVFTKLPLECGVNGDGLFNNTLLSERSANWDSLCRMISLCLRFGIPLDKVVKQLDRSSYSMVDAPGIISRVLKRYVKIPEHDQDNETGKVLGSKCTECGEMAVIKEGGCEICTQCGASKCS